MADQTKVCPIGKQADGSRACGCGQPKQLEDFTRKSRSGKIRINKYCHHCNDQNTKRSRNYKSGRGIAWNLLRDGQKKRLYRNLSDEWFEQQLAKQSGKCYWTGQGMRTNPADREKPDLISIDRIDQAADHTIANCVLTTRFVNLGRNRYQGNMEDFLKQLFEALKAKIEPNASSSSTAL